jgi:hypothetical protein
MAVILAAVNGGTRMLTRLFPRVLDNHHRGHPAAIWLLVPVVLMKAVMGFNCAGLNPFVDNREIMEGVDGIPLSTFPPQAADALVFTFSAWGLGLLLLSLVAVVALVRYRAMIPMIYLLLGAEQLGRQFLFGTNPIERLASGHVSAALVINLALSTILVVGFVLSLWGPRREQ